MIKSNLCSKCHKPIPCDCARKARKAKRGAGSSGGGCSGSRGGRGGGRGGGRRSSFLRWSDGQGGISGNAGYYDDRAARKSDCQIQHSNKFVFDLTCDCGHVHEVAAQFSAHITVDEKLIDIFSLDRPLLCACGLLTTGGRADCAYPELFINAVTA